MIHLHWYTIAVVALCCVLAGAVLMGVVNGERIKQLRARLVAARAANDRLQLACRNYERALWQRDDQIVELEAELVVTRNSGDVPPEAA